MSEIDLVWNDDLRLAESPVWDKTSRKVLFADLVTGRIFSYGIDDAKRQTWKLPAPQLGSFGMCESGRLIIALARSVIIYDLNTSAYEVLIDNIEEPKQNCFNDGKVGPDGCFWVGTKTKPAEPGAAREVTGQLYRITPDGQALPKSQGYGCSNGLAWSPDGKVMYHADTAHNYIDAWDFDRTNGEIENRRRFVTLGIDEGQPDGAACDAQGNYWVALLSGRLNKYSSSGELLETIKMPCVAPTMPCFADEFLFVTSLCRGSEARSAPSASNGNFAGLFRMRAPCAGAVVGNFKGL